jgi:hypothetical protein
MHIIAYLAIKAYFTINAYFFAFYEPKERHIWSSRFKEMPLLMWKLQKCADTADIDSTVAPAIVLPTKDKSRQ